jgi:hypothetical protein
MVTTYTKSDDRFSNEPIVPVLPEIVAESCPVMLVYFGPIDAILKLAREARPQPNVLQASGLSTIHSAELLWAPPLTVLEVENV